MSATIAYQSVPLACGECATCRTALRALADAGLGQVEFDNTVVCASQASWRETLAAITAARAAAK